MIGLSDKGNRTDKPTFRVAPSKFGKIERAVRATLSQLSRVGGSPVDPDNVLAALRCAREERIFVPRDRAASVAPHSYTVPAPVHVWVRVAWLDVGCLGLRSGTVAELKDACIPYVGTLLLYTQAELADRCSALAVKDIVYCLDRHRLRLPSAVELSTAKAVGFWVELPAYSKKLRFATELVGYLQIDEIKELYGLQEGFFEWAEVVTLGELLTKPAGDFRELMQDYVFSLHTGDDREKEQDLPDAVGEALCAKAGRLADAVADWMAAAGLEFAKI